MPMCGGRVKSEEGVASLSVGVADVPQPPDVGAENQLSVLRK